MKSCIFHLVLQHKLDQVKTQLEEAQGIRDVKEAARKEAEDAERKHLDDESARNADSQKGLFRFFATFSCFNFPKVFDGCLMLAVHYR